MLKNSLSEKSVKVRSRKRRWLARIRKRKGKSTSGETHMLKKAAANG
jgi:hypothetical protein